jgi:hypothetical protein
MILTEILTDSELRVASLTPKVSESGLSALRLYYY